jgi:lysozyme
MPTPTPAQKPASAPALTITPKVTVDGPALFGCDIYHGDGDVQMHALAAAGLSYVWIKATQGLVYTDPKFQDNWARAKSAGLVRGAYHFFNPDANPLQQAAHLVNTVKLQKGDLVLALDVETDGLNVGAKSHDCAAEIKRLTGRWPAIYTSDSFYREHMQPYYPIGSHLLWIARYGGRPQTPCQFWQYSDAGRVQGVAHNLDTDVFFGNVDLLKTHCV